MTTQDNITAYINSHPEPKRADLEKLDKRIRAILPNGKLWFFDGRNDEGKVVSNPNIGYGEYLMKYADGSTRKFYQIGLSANTSGISVYILGIDDKKYLTDNFAKDLGKASVTGYCIKFKKLQDIDLKTIEAAIRYGIAASGGK